MDHQTTSAAPEDSPVYEGKIIDQIVSKNRDGDLQLILTVLILSKLNNPKNPADGVQECPRTEQEVRLTVVENDDNRLRMLVRDLDRLGFLDDDLSRLHPEHPECFSLLERAVHLRCKTVGDREFWNLAWPGAKPKPVAVDELRQKAASLRTKVAGARKRLQEDNSSRKAPPPNAPAVSPQPAVGY